MKPDFKNESGFSLVESIIYLAIFVMLSTLLIDSLLLMSRTYNVTRVNRDLLDSVNVPLERMTRDIRGAPAVVVGNSTFATSPGKLTIRNADSSTESFALVSNAIQFTDTTGTTNNLTGSQIVVDSLVFRNISTAQGSAVKIEITEHSLRSPNAQALSVSDTVALRGSY